MSITDSRIRLSGTVHTTRRAAVAGMFYPEKTDDLRTTVNDLLENAGKQTDRPKAIISPHAGYIYSGEAAAEVYSSLKSADKKIKRVVLLGPAHRVRVKGLAAPSVSSFRTPLGDVLLDKAALKKIEKLPQLSVNNSAHKQEHSLEVQLPFLQECLGNFSLVPLVVGYASAEEVAEVLELLWGGDETLIVISSDLSHFHEYDESKRIDKLTSSIIENFDFTELKPEQACGAHPLKGMLLCARKRNMTIQRRALCNSGDTAGGHDRVVGYGSWCLFEKRNFNDVQRNLLIQIAEQSIRHGLNHGSPLPVDPSEYATLPAENAACFVTLKKNDKLRGCIGNTQASVPLVRAIAESAFSAAFKDPRFPALGEEELASIDISISVLSPEEELSFADENELLEIIRPGTDGLIIENGRHKATFLPSVWESLPEKTNFLAHLKSKAGIKAGMDILKAWRYTAEYID